MTLRERFDLKYMAEPMSGCWLWTAADDGRGYGVIGVGSGVDKAHRVAWQLFKGPIPTGLDVLHRCDVPSCVNPDHLWLGTAKDNAADMMAKGRNGYGMTTGDAHWMRQFPERRLFGDKNPSRRHPERVPRGERQGAAKLTDAAVRQIRAEYTGRRGQQTALAARFGVSRRAIYVVTRGLGWRHV